MSDKKRVILTFKQDKDTKNTRRFQEVVEEEGQTPTMGTIWVQLSTIAALGNPMEIQLTLEA